MATYPITVPRKHYRGSKDSVRRKVAERNELARVLEDYVNRKVEEDVDPNCCVLLYGFIASDLGSLEETVRRILFAVDCGHNGITVWKPGGYARWYKEVHGTELPT